MENEVLIVVSLNLIDILPPCQFIDMAHIIYNCFYCYYICTSFC